jgi:hypothetical protein
MTRAQLYQEGWHEGRRWAEEDLHEGRTLEAQEEALRYEAHRSARDRLQDAPLLLGRARGYRDTVDRFERGETSWETI